MARWCLSIFRVSAVGVPVRGAVIQHPVVSSGLRPRCSAQLGSPGRVLVLMGPFQLGMFCDSMIPRVWILGGSAWSQELAPVSLWIHSNSGCSVIL